MSTPDRRAMLDRDARGAVDPPAMRAARAGALGRLPAAPAGQRRRSGADAADRRAVHGVAVPRLAADGGDAAGRGPAGQPQAGAAADAPDGDRGARPEAADDEAGAGPQDLPLPAARPGDRPAEPGLGGRHHLHPDRPRLPLSGGDHRLGEPGGAGVAAVEHAWTRRSASTALEEALARFGRPEIFNTDQGSQFTSAAFTGTLAAAGIRSRWTGAAAGWTTSSSSGCGARSSTRTSISRATPTAARPGPGSRPGSPSTTTGGRTRRWATARRWRSGATASTGALGDNAVDMTLRLDNAGALPTCPQPTTAATIHRHGVKERTEPAALQSRSPRQWSHAIGSSSADRPLQPTLHSDPDAIHRPLPALDPLGLPARRGTSSTIRRST